MKTLNEYLQEARTGGYGLGHFNFATADVLQAIVQGAKEAGAPAVMVGTSEGEAEFIGMRQAVALVHAARRTFDFPVFLNADHYKSPEKCKEAIDLGYDAVIIDTSKLPYEDNIRAAKTVVGYAQAKDPAISVEGEIGYLKGSSELQKTVEISSADYTQPAQVTDFVHQTGVHRLAIVFGNIHGIVTEQEEHLDIAHFKKLVAAAPETYFVLHGASGLADKEVYESIRAGIANIHFNTELRVAYTVAVKKHFEEKPKETTPYKYMIPARTAVQELVAKKTLMFMGK